MFTKQTPVASEELMDACYHFSWRLPNLQQNQQDTAQTHASTTPPHRSMISGKSGFVRGLSQIAD